MDYENEIFPILSSAHARTNVILAGKCVCHSTSSFSENVVVAETSYKMLEVLSFCVWKRAYPPKINCANVFGKKVQ